MTSATEHKNILMQDILAIRDSIKHFRVHLKSATKLATDLALSKSMSRIEQKLDRIQQDILNLPLD